MESGSESVLVAPMAAGRRRHKAAAPWRFQRGFVRGQVQACAKRPRLETPESSEESAGGIGILGSESDGGSGDSKLRRPATASNGGGELSKEGGGGGGGGGEALRNCNLNLDGLDGTAADKDSNLLAKDCNLGEAHVSNGVTKEPTGAVEPTNIQGFHCSGSDNADEINPIAKDCRNSEGFRTGDVVITGCRKGRKAVLPWRFQVGYKRTCSSSGNGSGTDGPAGTTTSKGRDVPMQRAPETGHNRPRENGSLPKKREVDESRRHPHRVTQNNRIAITRESVMSSLREFRIIYRVLLEEEEAKWRQRGHGLRPDLAALRIFREKLSVDDDDDKRHVGSVPGVQIGDKFNSRVEISIVGLHCNQLMSVDCINKDGTFLAVSIVSHAQPSSSNNNLDFLLHVGSITATDQNLEGTDMALKQSMDTNTPIRVIHVVTGQGENGQQKGINNYFYGGLYLVQKFIREKVNGDQYIHTFHLRRMTGQPHFDIQKLANTRKTEEAFGGVFMADISGGLEKIPVSAINSISNEYPMSFRYISQMQYTPKYEPGIPSGCDCVNGCSDSQKCACAVKNGGHIPFSNKGGLIDEEPLIYECGPSCKCPPTCHNRVSQHGIKFRLQVFKTKSMGWGVRSLDFIPSGSFVCEYIGELLEEEEAQERENDEYLFGIGNNYYDESRWEGKSKVIPSLQHGPSEDDETGFAIDTLKCGNFAKFINHSCSPNLFAQNVLYDHDNKSIPHIMFFAGAHIPPLQELSYDYNYTIDEVHDADGNIKKKQCFCGSIECTGWLY